MFSINWGSAWSTIEKGLDVVSTGMGLYKDYTSIRLAQKQQDMQESEYRRQQRIAAAAARREARVKKAQLYASQGSANAMTSVTQMGVIGLDTTLGAGLEDLADRTAYNIRSSKAQETAAITSAAASGVLGAANFAAAAKDFNFTDIITKEQSSPYGPYRADYSFPTE